MYRKIEILFKQILYYVLYKLFLFCKIDTKKIVIVNYYGKGYGDNSKYIVEELIRQKKEYTIIWLVRKEILNEQNSFPKNVQLVKYESFEAHRHLATAGIWFDNCRKPWYVQKRKKQFYIQLWHGSPALKKIEADAEKSLSRMYLYNAKTDSNKIDIFVSNCTWFTSKINGTFWYDGEIKEVGLPRNDILFQDINIKKKFENKYNTEDGTKFILYAPTFRRNLGLDVYDVDFDNLLNLIENKTGKKWRVLVRLHPNISTQSVNLSFSEKIMDVSNYPDLQELLVLSDILITDYSSVMFDFAITKKPVFLYCNDLEAYKADRDLYFDISNLPFQITYTNEQLIESLLNFSNEVYQQELNLFFEEIGLKEDGKAAYKIVNIIDQLDKY